MNTPGSPAGNWGWRYRDGSLTLEAAARLRRLVELGGRLG
jgi:4-alpha-glucanotransferase